MIRLPFHFAVPRGAPLEERRGVLAHILKTYGVSGYGNVRFVGERDYGRLYVIEASS